MRNESGTSIVYAILVLLVLSILSATLFSTISTDIESTAMSVTSSKVYGIAEGATRFGAQALEDDVDAAYQTADPTANGYAGVMYLEGGYNNNFTISGGSDAIRGCLHKRRWDQNADNRFARLDRNQTGSFTLWDFQQRINLIGSRIKRVRVVLRARKNSNGGTSPIVQLQYTTNGGTTYVDLGSTITLSSNSFTEYYREIATVPSDVWRLFMKGSADDLRLRVTKTNTGNRHAYIDWLAFEITLENDSLQEPWSSGSYASGGSFPDSLGAGQITSVTTIDESSKIHLNYAPQILLRRLIEYAAGISNGSSLADAIIAYRGTPLTNPFNSLEELKQVAGITTVIYEALEDYVTVYSWVNQDVTRPTGSRAPVNINTAPETVLKAILRVSFNNNNNRIDNTAAAIIARRATLPFTHMHSNKATQPSTRDLQSLSGWLYGTTISGLTNGNRNRILNVADGTRFNRGTNNGDPDRNWVTNNQNSNGTEFCFYANTFLITAVGEDGGVSRTIKTTYGHQYSYTTYSLQADGSYKIPTYVGETPRAYWREVRP